MGKDKDKDQVDDISKIHADDRLLDQAKSLEDLIRRLEGEDE